MGIDLLSILAEGYVTRLNAIELGESRYLGDGVTAKRVLKPERKMETHFEVHFKDDDLTLQMDTQTASVTIARVALLKYMESERVESQTQADRNLAATVRSLLDAERLDLDERIPFESKQTVAKMLRGEAMNLPLKAALVRDAETATRDRATWSRRLQYGTRVDCVHPVTNIVSRHIVIDSNAESVTTRPVGSAEDSALCYWNPSSVWPIEADA